MKRTIGFVALGTVLVLLVGCAEGVRSRSGLQPEGDPATERQIGIYAAVIRQLVTKDHTFGGGDPGFRVIYVLDRTVGKAGDPEGTSEEEGQPLSSEVRDGIRAALRGLPPIEFISDADSVIGPLSKGNQVKNQGALVTLAPIPGSEDRVEVGASLYIANLAGTWLTYVVENAGSEWKVTGTTGPVAIS